MLKLKGPHQQRAWAEDALQRILTSPEFRSSKRSIDFLTYVVRKWIDNDCQSIREKSIAIEVFGRSENYDPSEDSFVRVKASELRKRLSDYYLGTGSSDPVLVEIPLGGYQPKVRLRAPESRSQLTSRNRLLVAAGSSLLVGLLVWSLWPLSATDRFWGPIKSSSKIVLIHLPTLPRYAAGTAPEQLEGDISGKKLTLRDEVVGMGASAGAMHVISYFLSSGQHYSVRMSRQVLYPDLRAGPAVLLGGFSSPPAIAEMRNWRYRMIQEGASKIVDTQKPGIEWRAIGLQDNGRAEVDRALVTRVLDTSTGNPLVSLCGITTFGTQAAAEFVASEQSLKELFSHAPRDWGGRNLQAVITVQVKDDAPGPQKLEAAWFW